MTQEQLIRGNELTKKIEDLEKSLNTAMCKEHNSVGIALGGEWLNITEKMAKSTLSYIIETLEDEINDAKQELEKL
jgi:hypothetical protein